MTISLFVILAGMGLWKKPDEREVISIREITTQSEK